MAKVRINRGLYNRASECATAVCEPVGRWMWLCQMPATQARASEFLAKAGVSVPLNLVVATRDGSLSATVDGTIEDADHFRQNVAAAVLYCELTRPPAFKTDKFEGVDYIIEKDGAI